MAAEQGNHERGDREQGDRGRVLGGVHVLLVRDAYGPQAVAALPRPDGRRCAPARAPGRVRALARAVRARPRRAGNTGRLIMSLAPPTLVARTPREARPTPD